MKAASDGYVGYVAADALLEGKPAPTHIVTVQRSFVYPEPELRKPHQATVSMGSRVHVAGEAEARGNRYVVLEDGTAIFAKHVQPIGALDGADYVGIAARFLETPYLWGGRSGLGIDCSGLVQLAMLMTGRLRRAIPTCRQQASASRSIAPKSAVATSYSGRAMSPSSRIQKPSSMPMATA